MVALETPFAAALNHLLAGEGWASGRLAPFAGHTVALAAPPLPELRFTILGDGQVAPAASSSEISLRLTLRPDALAALTHGEEHFVRAIGVAGDARLASEVLLLVRHLRWDAEDDLARVLGDVVAHRLVSAAKGLVAWQADAGRRLAESFAEYAVEERRMLVKRGELDLLAARTARLRDDLERLEKRLERLG